MHIVNEDMLRNYMRTYRKCKKNALALNIASDFTTLLYCFLNITLFYMYVCINYTNNAGELV